MFVTVSLPLVGESEIVYLRPREGFMKQALLVFAAALVVGAAAYVGTNFRFEVRPNSEFPGGPRGASGPVAAETRPPEPGRLPGQIEPRHSTFAGDRDVVPASFDVPALVAPVVLGQNPGPQISEVSDLGAMDSVSLKWKSSFPNRPIIVTGQSVKVKIGGTLPKDYAIQISAIEETPTPPEPTVFGPLVTKPDEITVTGLTPGKKFRLHLEGNKQADKPSLIQSLSVITAATSPTPVFAIQNLKLNRYATGPGSAIPQGNAPGQPLSVYNGYLQVQLQIPAGFRPEFEVYAVTGKPVTADFTPQFRVNSELIASEPDRFLATYQLSLPASAADQICLLVVRAENGSQYLFTTAPLFYRRVNRTPDQLPRPTISDTGVSVKASVDASNPNNFRFRTSARKVTLTGSFDATPDLASDVYVLTINDRSGTPLTVALQPNLTWTTTADLPSDGIYEFQIRPAIGISLGDPTLRFTVHTNTVGPQVIGIFPTDLFETPRSLKQIEVAFSPEVQLDPTTAQTNTNYTVRALTGAGFKSAATEVQPTSVARIPDSNRLRLTFADEFPLGTYALSVSANVKDIFGNAVQTVTGSVVEFRRSEGTGPRSIVDDLPSEVRGVRRTLEPAPVVTYPEYTQVREYPEGFNPSDRVETRVAYLYYYRDAHRVAQIINRALKSYNAASVDTRRRAADRIRDDANKATDERRRLEAAAELAARQSRIAEAELGAAQADIGNLRGAELEARNQRDNLLGQRQAARSQLDLFRQDQAKRDNLNLLEDRRFAEGLAGEMLVGNQKKYTQAQIDELVEARKVERAQRTREQEAAFTAQISRLEADLKTLEENVSRTETGSRTVADRIKAAAARVQARREEEARATEAARAKGEEENRLREEQFRREVAAAREDPDSYAPGIPDSKDPVLQCSISVIGEGKIHLRGPLKGLNVIRTMINQIDAPVGQVRLGVHTVQVNGERGDRMERVVGDIQEYIDHARYLTLTTTTLLRRAITQVAARKAEEATIAHPDRTTQADRDQMYLDAFFGAQFLQELRTLDSEFLMSGNKILSLHSMDNTSLAGGLFIWALAKNTIRIEILQEFQLLIQDYLPTAEINFLTAGEGSMCKHGKKCKSCDKCGPLLAYNARFQSLIAFFENQVGGADTITPIQREFIRLAQIFKARLITEKELKQRVLERSLVEERIRTNYTQELQNARNKEVEARTALDAARTELIKLNAGVGQSITLLIEKLRTVQGTLSNISAIARSAADKYLVIVDTLKQPGEKVYELAIQKQVVQFELPDLQGLKQTTSDPPLRLTEKSRRELTVLFGLLEQLNYYDPRVATQYKSVAEQYRKFIDPASGFTSSQFDELAKSSLCLLELISPYLDEIEQKLLRLFTKVRQQEELDSRVYERFAEVRALVLKSVQGDLLTEVTRTFDQAEIALRLYFNQQTDFVSKARIARAVRHPLDYKKLLDLFVDDVEEKYIEQLEGTRAHIANIDNFIKGLATALDDDLNRQFYYPAFRCVRQASRSWDVTLGQIETTTILTNNRAFAKVDPSATMEFDLPKRDPLIVEAMAGAKALIDQYGALVNDPSFLSLVKLRSGQPVSSPVQGALFNGSPVRNILPGLATTTDEQILSQAGPGRREFQSPLEALIPDPAIYKFETGTGFEIRPVVSPDGQNVVFNFNYMYTTNIREPVRADEKHLGRVKRHYINTDVQLSNYELREVSRYLVALKASRTGRGVQLLQDIPGLGVLFRPLPSAESSLQQNIILAQATIFPTLFELMGLRWAPAIADIDPLQQRNMKFVVEQREKFLQYQAFDESSRRVDDAVLVPNGMRRPDLYRPQETIPYEHPNGYRGVGQGEYDSRLKEGYAPEHLSPERQYAPRNSREGDPYRPDLPAREFEGLPLGVPSLGLPPVMGSPIGGSPHGHPSDRGHVEIVPHGSPLPAPSVGNGPPAKPDRPNGPVLGTPVSQPKPARPTDPARPNSPIPSVPPARNNR